MTPEESLGRRLLTFWQDDDSNVILSFHPPGAKSYYTPLVRIPRRRAVSKRERYHIDMILRSSRFLVFLELKGHSSQVNSDIQKLEEIREDFTLHELLALLIARGVLVDELAHIDSLAVGIGFETCAPTWTSEREWLFAVHWPTGEATPHAHSHPGLGVQEVLLSLRIPSVDSC